MNLSMAVKWFTCCCLYLICLLNRRARQDQQQARKKQVALVDTSKTSSDRLTFDFIVGVHRLTETNTATGAQVWYALVDSTGYRKGFQRWVSLLCPEMLQGTPKYLAISGSYLTI